MLSDELKKTRQKSFLTQTEFAKEIGVSFSTVNRWESGKGKPNLTAMKNIKQFCENNNISYDEIETEWLKKSQEVQHAEQK